MRMRREKFISLWAQDGWRKIKSRKNGIRSVFFHSFAHVPVKSRRIKAPRRMSVFMPTNGGKCDLKTITDRPKGKFRANTQITHTQQRSQPL
jgi:hypothetical protein